MLFLVPLLPPHYFNLSQAGFYVGVGWSDEICQTSVVLLIHYYYYC